MKKYTEKEYEIINLDFASLYTTTFATSNHIDEYVNKKIKNDLRKKKLESL
ncbi:hypothetical protein M0Q50_07865 [bacterium]|jgi:hypothetical protein|nr:hypothetical protein [bacterium]